MFSFIEKVDKSQIATINPTRFRLKYAGTHLLISVLVALLSLGLVFFVWYPAPLSKALGVTSLFLMMLAIDVILGPLLTLLVAKPNKKTLKFDLVVIATLQMMALLYGLYNIHLGRPAYFAFDVTRFEIAEVKNIAKDELEKAISPYDSIPFTPQWVAVQRPKTADEQLKRMMIQIETGYPQTLKASLYEPVENQWQIILDESKPLEKLKDFNEPLVVEDIMAQYPDAKGFLPLKSPKIDMTVLVGDDGFVKVVDLRPWN